MGRTSRCTPSAHATRMRVRRGLGGAWRRPLCPACTRPRGPTEASSAPWAWGTRVSMSHTPPSTPPHTQRPVSPRWWTARCSVPRTARSCASPCFSAPRCERLGGAAVGEVIAEVSGGHGMVRPAECRSLLAGEGPGHPCRAPPAPPAPLQTQPNTLPPPPRPIHLAGEGDGQNGVPGLRPAHLRL